MTSNVRAGCPEDPSTLAAMRDCFRAVLVFAPAENDPLFRIQVRELESDPAAFTERDMLLVPILPEIMTKHWLNAKVPTAHFKPDEVARAREQFGSRNPNFEVVLVGKDGTEKLRSKKPVSLEEMNSLIDSMPMRKQEKKEQ